MSVVTELKKIEFKVVDGKMKFAEPFIMANGKKLTWYDSVSFDRLTHYEKLMVEAGLNKTLPEIYEDFNGIYQAANKMEFANVCVIAYNAMKGLRELDDETRVQPCFKMVSLFLNYEGEDIRYVDEKVIKQKYDDICIEGYNPESFFSLAIAFIPGFIHAYEEATKGTSLQEKTQVGKEPQAMM